MGNRRVKNRPALVWSDDLLLDQVLFEGIELFREYSLPHNIQTLDIYLNESMAERRILAGLAQYVG